MKLSYSLVSSNIPTYQNTSTSIASIEHSSNRPPAFLESHILDYLWCHIVKNFDQIRTSTFVHLLNIVITHPLFNFNVFAYCLVFVLTYKSRLLSVLQYSSCSQFLLFHFIMYCKVLEIKISLYN